MENQFWKWLTNESSNELIIDGVIASDSWYEDEVTPKLFREELAKHPGPVTVRINSPGGDVFAGMSIYNALREHDGEVTIKVDGIAASAASFISMAGDKIIMLPGAMMMVHNPSTFAWGNVDDLEKAIDMLKKTAESMVSIYTARTGLSAERVEELLAAETWMTGEDAVELGFATEAVPAKAGLAQAMAKVAQYSDTVKSALTQPALALQAKLEAPAANNGNSDEVKPDTSQTEAIDESDIEAEETNQETDEGNKPMNPQEAIAATQAMEPQAQAPVEATPKAQSYADYLKSPKAVEDFANVLAQHPGDDNPAASQAVRAAWKEIAIKNGLSEDSADYFRLPDPIVTQIEDAVKASGIFNALTHTGLDVRRVDWDDTDENAETSRAGGHKKGTSKSEQVLDFEKRVIRAQYIYKYLTLNKQDVRENKNSGALIRFVMNELPTRVIREIERAVVIGDGRAEDSDRKIQEGTPEGFYPIKTDAANNNIFAMRYEPVPGDKRYETIVKAMDEIETEGGAYLIHKKGYLTGLKLQKDDNGSFIFPIGGNVAKTLELAGTFQPTWFNDTTDPDNDAYLVVLSGYETVGDSSIEAFTNFILKENKHEYLQEVYKGGGLAKRRATVAIAKETAPAEPEA